MTTAGLIITAGICLATGFAVGAITMQILKDRDRRNETLWSGPMVESWRYNRILCALRWYADPVNWARDDRCYTDRGEIARESIKAASE